MRKGVRKGRGGGEAGEEEGEEQREEEESKRKRRKRSGVDGRTPGEQEARGRGQHSGSRQRTALRLAAEDSIQARHRETAFRLTREGRQERWQDRQHDPVRALSGDAARVLCKIKLLY